MAERDAASVNIHGRVAGKFSSATKTPLLAIILIATAILGLSVFMAWEVPRISHVTAAHTDFIETLYGLRAFESGQNPYGNAVSAHVDALMAGHPLPPPPGGHYEHPFLYVLPQALIYLPVTPLPDEAAITLVRACTVALYIVALLALIGRFADALPVAGRVGLMLIGLAWWPFLSVILPIVQQAGTIFALLVLATLAAERGQWFWSGVACFLALLKPTESALVVLVLAMWAIRWPAGRRPFLAGALAIGLPATALAFAVRPTWIPDWIRVLGMLQAGHFDYHVDLESAIAGLLGVPSILTWCAAIAVCGACGVMAWRAAGRAARSSDPGAERLWWWVGLMAVLTLLMVPRTGAYDIVIALIAWFIALDSARRLRTNARRLTYAALTGLLLAAGVLAYRDHAAAELPALAVLLIVALWLCRLGRGDGKLFILPGGLGRLGAEQPAR